MNFIQKFIDNSMDMVRNMTILDVTIFKFTIFVAVIWIVKLFPIIASLNIWIYIAVWAG